MINHEPFTNIRSGCTVTKPATSSVVEVCHDCSSTTAPVVESETAVVPVPETTPVQPETIVEPVQSETPSVPAAPYPSANGTVPVAPTGTGAPTETASGEAPVFEGAASAITATGAGILAIFGLVAAL